mmetsp:Transcript_35500/g.43473  ORF Transcript_35500/g.43473 Transcript_35500/m.43473 type:complete len:99 (+) Transcript_35500:351-647(+)
MLVFGDTESRRHVRKVVNAFGVDFEPNGFAVRDNSQAEATTVRSKNLFKPLAEMKQPVFDQFDSSSAGVSFEGVGAALDQENQFVFPILRAESTTLSA